MNWIDLLSDKRIHNENSGKSDNSRSPFQADQDKIIFSPHFRRLQNKTQLFPLPKSDRTHTRLTHSLEVASIGRSLAFLIGEKISQNHKDHIGEIEDFPRKISEIVYAACLLHDMGNTAFGHFGEDVFKCFFETNQQLLKFAGCSDKLLSDLKSLDGNTHGLYLIKNDDIFNLTSATLGAFIKYPTTSTNYEESVYSKYGVYYNYEEFIKEIFEDNLKIEKISGKEYYPRHPLAFIVEAADDICNIALDYEDAMHMDLIPTVNNYRNNILLDLENNKELKTQLLGNDKLSKEVIIGRSRTSAIFKLMQLAEESFMNNYNEIMSGKYESLLSDGKITGLLDVISDATVKQLLEDINEDKCKYAFNFPPVLKIELAGAEILTNLLQRLIFAILSQVTIDSGDTTLEQQFNIIKSNEKIHKKVVKLFFKDELNNKYNIDKIDKDTINNVIMISVDYIAGMTDMFATKLYKKINAIDLVK